MMKLKELFSAFKIRLQNIYPVGESQAIAQLVFEHVFNTDNFLSFQNSELIVDEKQNEFLETILKRLLNHEPIQYVFGEADFYGLKFKVNKSVLIPRPETEELVEWSIASVTAAATILDIGTGSGCIAISIKKKILDANVYAMDISEESLNVAKQNAKQNNVEVEFIQQDILSFESNVSIPPLGARGPAVGFDLIVSNPPYITSTEKKQMDKNVLQYEPHSALFVADADALIFYKAIVNFALKYLNKNGLLFFEINQNKGKEVVELIASNGFNNIELKKDMSGNDRMIKAQL